MTAEGFFIGIVLALLYAEWMDILPGGIIVPAFLALYMDQPMRVVLTVAVAFLTLFAYRILAAKLILFGRRRFVLLILLGAVGTMVFSFGIIPVITPLEGFRSIGWIIPGLLANNLDRQPWIPTLASMFTVSILVFFIIKLIGFLGG